MTRSKEADQMATRAFNAAVEVINEAPDLGIALAAMSMVCRWMQAETESRLLAVNKTLAEFVIGGEER